MELKRCSDTLAQVLKTVGWNSATFRSYLSFAEDEAVNIRLILMNREGEESSCDESDDAPSPDPPPMAFQHPSSSSVSSTSESF